MIQIKTYDSALIDDRRLLIPNLQEYLKRDESYSHLIKGTLLCFCQNGSATIKINYQEYHLTPRTVLAILPTHVFRMVECQADTVIEALLYSDDYWTTIAQSVDYQLIKLVESNPLAHLPANGLQEVDMLMGLIKNHDCAAPTEQRNQMVELNIVRSAAFSLLMLVVSFIEPGKEVEPHFASRKEVLTHDFFDLLLQHFETERLVSFYASKLCVTPKYLSSMVKEVTRQPIQEWISNVTILNIKRHLLTSQDSIQEIADKLKFQTPSTLIRYFRIHTGTTPSKFRAKALHLEAVRGDD
jgi:AraC-like DNA-binding protein